MVVAVLLWQQSCGLLYGTAVPARTSVVGGSNTILVVVVVEVDVVVPVVMVVACCGSDH